MQETAFPNQKYTSIETAEVERLRSRIAELDLNKIAMEMKVLPPSAGTIFGLTPQELGALLDELAFLRKAYPRLRYMQSLERQLGEAKRLRANQGGAAT